MVGREKYSFAKSHFIGKYHTIAFAPVVGKEIDTLDLKFAQFTILNVVRLVAEDFVW